MVLEGGYNLEAIGPCAVAAIGGLGKSIDQGFPTGAPTAEERASVDAAARIHGVAHGE
jgi:acetoin utilization deacetylase AcuC-like enzyme